MEPVETLRMLGRFGNPDVITIVNPRPIYSIDVTGGEAMCEFLKDWNVPYVFGLAGSEEVGFLDALVDSVDPAAGLIDKFFVVVPSAFLCAKVYQVTEVLIVSAVR